MLLKKFTTEDWFGFQGAQFFDDGSEPLIHYFGDEKVLILDNEGLSFGIGSEKWYQLECTKELGRLLSIVMMEEITEEELIAYGFEDIM